MKCSNIGISGRFPLVFLLCLAAAGPVFGGGTKSLPGHVPAVISRLQPLGSLSATN